MARYYAQRATAGMIISEATGISQQGLGWPYAPGIWSRDQVTAWQAITHAVHEAGGRIILQLWHMGRVVHPSFLGGEKPVSASATTAPGLAHTYAGKLPYVEARALAGDEITQIVADYRKGAENAMTAGFDGVQLHAANGYLIDQFLRDKTNLRDDDYGGSVDNRLRLLHDVASNVADTVGPGRTGVRLSPNEEVQGVNDTAPEILFTAAARMLSDLGVAHLELREPGENSTFQTAERPPIAPLIRKAFAGRLILNSGYDAQRAQSALGEGGADAISFGRPFIANPDLPRRLAQAIPLQQEKTSDWYGPTETGYADYPEAPARVEDNAEA
jgi:2,4-dienoyl-CoA reductase-like NADH-dependent reductase (Old Yellow Enzyme family)